MNQRVSLLRYRLGFTAPQAHLVDVELVVPEVTGPVRLWMPVWTPGSYLIREYSRHVEGLTAADPDGNALTIRKTHKNRWEVEPGDASEIVVRYRVYGREKSVRTNWVDADYALLNGASTFLTVDGWETRPHRVVIEPPAHWSGLHTALRRDPGTERTFTAADHDELVDSPIQLGNPAVHAFEIDGVPFTLVNEGEGGLWDGPRAAEDVATIVRAYRDLYGGMPLDRYVFHNLIVEAGGGLEHKHGSVLMTSRYAYRDRTAYVRWLGLVSHEFLHVWNVKRSRPAELGPFDYENEVYTRSLWVAEGFTAYYTDLIPHRAGLTSESEYLGILSTQIGRLQNVHGRSMQSLEESSFDAWIKLYRADENTANTTVSYYLKGAVVAMLLDCEIRHATAGKRSLDDVMRILFERYAGERGFETDAVQGVCEEVADTSLRGFFDRAVRSTRELDYEPLLTRYGLRFKPDPHEAKPWLGLEIRDDGGRLFIKSVGREGPGYEAGLNAEDEILAVGGYRVMASELPDRMKQYEVGDRVEVLVSRAGAVRTVPVELAAHPGDPWQLEVHPDAGSEAVTARTTWLGTGAT